MSESPTNTKPYVRNRRLVLILVICVIATASVALFWAFVIFFSPRTVTQSEFDLIQNGMTLDEVNSFLRIRMSSSDVPGQGQKEICIWTGTEGTAIVWFDAEGRVYFKRYPPETRYSMFLRKLRSIIGL